MNIVRERSRNSSAWRSMAGCVVSSTCRFFAPKVRLRTSGASEEPPSHGGDEQRKARRSLAGKCGQPAGASLLRFRLVEPSEPHLLAGVRPDGRVARPDALDELLARGDGQADTSSPDFD